MEAGQRCDSDRCHERKEHEGSDHSHRDESGDYDQCYQKGLSNGFQQAEEPLCSWQHVTSRRPLRLGEVTIVKIERADEYDLHGTAVGY